ncbi:GAF domain-containing protein [Halobellus marinus]|uniref:GAF domain-containing protein n=1 Tax=Halobellus TaxID=1073986 RepID=UPI0028AF0E27|nr:GAF domain-containing protein [Halobellus sp. DFY28]
MTGDAGGGRILVVPIDDQGGGVTEDVGDEVAGSTSAGEHDAASRTASDGSGQADSEGANGWGRQEQGYEPPIVDDLRAQIDAELIVRCAETAVEYVSELGPTLDCIVILGDDTDLFRDLVQAAEIPIIVYDSTVIAVSDASVPEENVVDELANRVHSEMRANRNQSKLRESNARLTALSRYARDITACETVDAIMERTLEATTDALAFKVCVVGLVHDGRLVSHASTLPEPGLDPISTEEGIAGRAYRTGEPQLVDDMQTDPDAVNKDDGRHATVAVPIGDEGVIQVVSDRQGAFDTRDLEFLEILAGYTKEALARIKREVTLREERDRLHTFFEELPMPALCVEWRDGDAKIEEVNEAYTEQFGEVGVCQPLAEAVSDAERRQYEQAVETGERSVETVERAGEDGSSQTFSLNLVPAAPPGARECVYGLYCGRSVQ